MKRIAIFIDGTWNRPDALHQTNVVLLSRCVKQRDAQGNTQQVIYSPGVGAGSGNNWLGRKMDQVFGGALGWGLTEIIEQAYRDLVFAYEPGDKIYIFGFSRGAYAARSLAGLVRSCGIAPRSHLARIPEAMKRYVSRDPATHPDTPASHVFRHEFSPRVATSAKELDWRRDHGDADSIRLRLQYVGVWDTVKALGLPAFLPGAARFNEKYKFHDARLSSSVCAARHAIAVDEKRITFPPSPWTNIAELNARTGCSDGETPHYAQQWFPGDHGSVGGGGSRNGLSTVSLHWIAQGAERENLALDWDEYDRLLGTYNPVKEHLTNKFGPAGAAGFLLNLLKSDRDGPKELDQVSVAALDRMRLNASYRPDTLNFVRDDVDGQPETELAALRDWLVARDGGPTHECDSVVRPRPWDAPRDAALTA